MKIRISFLSLLFLVSLQPSAFPQGSIVPTSAPNVPTMKTLQQIEPRMDLKVLYDQNHDGIADDANYEIVITQPGSYYLSSNMGPAPSPAPMSVTRPNGIQINAEGVTLDLHGFQVSRSSGSGGHGIEITAISHRASVRNGSLKGFAYGIRSLLATGYARACAFRDLSVSNCTNVGIFAGEGAVLEACRAHDNTGNYGIYADAGSSFTNCTAESNTTTYAILSSNASSLNNCTATNNAAAYGIYASPGSSLTNCTAANNTGIYGIYGSSGSSLTNCSAYGNQSSAAISAGFGTFTRCTIINCTSFSNLSTVTSTSTTGMGFDLRSGGNTIQGCTASLNQGDGIRSVDNSVIAENNCDGNGNGSGIGAGIHVTGSGNRIESNNTTNNDTGVLVDAAGNLIIKNSSRGGSAAFTIAAGNSKGEEINVYNPVTTTIITSSNSWANFLY